MARPKRHAFTPAIEFVERRKLPSGVIASMASSQPALMHSHHVAATAGPANAPLAGAQQGGSFVVLGGAAAPRFLAPSGQPTRTTLARFRFQSSFIGPFYVVPGRTSTEAKQIFIRGKGTSTAFHHGNIQIHLVIPADPTQPVLGMATQLDRNINDSGILGFDLTGSTNDADARGRPTHLTYQIDINVSAGTFVEASGQGTVDIRYSPQHKHLKGQFGPKGAGTAFVRTRGFVLTFGENNPLRNSDIGI